MEDAPLCREIKFAHNGSNDSRDREWAVAVGTELDRGVLMEMEVFALEPGLIANGILIRGDISGPFLMGDKEGQGEVRAELGKFEEMIGDSRGGRGRGGEGKRSQLITHEGTEGGGINGRMVADVVSEFSSGEVVHPVVLTNRAVSTKILFQFLVNMFGLTISLGVISRAHGLLDVKEFAEFGGEGGGKLRTAIGDEFSRKAKALPDVITIEGCGLIGGDGCGARGEYCGFSDAMVNKNSDGVIALGYGKFDNKVHGDCGERGSIGFRENRLKWSRGVIGEVFSGLAGGAAVNIILDKASHSCPPKGSREEFISFEVTGMTGTRRFVVEGDDIVMEFGIMRDIQLSF